MRYLMVFNTGLWDVKFMKFSYRLFMYNALYPNSDGYEGVYLPVDIL